MRNAATLALGLLATGLLWFVRQPMFALQAIRLDGDLAHNSVLTLRANAVPRMAGNFFTMNLGATQRAFESVPWVRKAIVRRVWPNKLAVRIEEHRPVALWSPVHDTDDGADKLVNSYGEVFEANLGDVEDDALPTLRGPDGTSSHMLAFWARMQEVVAGLGAAHIDTLELSGRGSWRAELDSGAEIEFGRGTDDEVVERARRFVATVSQVTQRYQRPLEYADLRHHEGYAVRLKGVSTAVDVAPGKAKN